MILRDRILLGGGVVAALLAGGAAWLLLGGAPTPAAFSPSDSGSGAQLGTPVPSSPARSPGSSDLVVDVEGGVAHPGIQRLPPGSRVADAIAAAGGYGGSADIGAASHSLNLAAPLADGAQVYVPRIGERPTSSSSSGGNAGTALVNLNSATPEQLDALPGIGPVTVQKIVAARQERPFQTLDELVERKVLTTSQLENLRDLVTVS